MTTEEKLKKVVREFLRLEKGVIKLESRIIDDLGGDSLEAIEVVMITEREFDVLINDDIFDSDYTFKELLNRVTNKR